MRLTSLEYLPVTILGDDWEGRTDHMALSEEGA